jgi:hypothetical protein
MSALVGQAQDVGPNYEHLKPIKGIVGNWKLEGEWKDGTKVEGEESSRWVLNKNFIQSKGWFTSHAGDRIDYQIVTGWDPADKKIVEWFSMSDGSYSKRVGTFDPATRAWASTETGVDVDGKPFSFDVVMKMVDKNTWTWKGTDFKGEETLPSELNIKFTKVPRTPKKKAAKK